MTTIQHVMAVGNSQPYVKMLRYVDGVPENAPIPAQAVSIQLGTCSASPDGRYWIAAGVVSSLTPFRMWKVDTNFDITAVPIEATLPAAGTIVDLKFVTNRHIVAVDSVGGVLFGVFDRTTNVITWTRINALANFVGVENLSDDRFILNRGPGTSPYSQIFVIVGDTATLETWSGNTANPYSDRSAVHRASKVVFGPRSNTNSASSAAQALWYDIATKTMSLTAAYIDFNASNDIAKIVNGSNGGTILCAKFSPSGRHIACGLNSSPFLRLATQISGRKYPNTIHKFVVAAEGALADDQPLAAQVNDVEFVGNDYLLVGVNSRFGGTGRVKGYFHSDGDEKLVEDMRIRTLFNDWDSICMNLTSGPLEVAGSESSLYNTASSTLVGRTGDLNNLKLALMDADAVFNPAHTTLAQVLGGDEVFGSSWPQGGIPTNDGTWSAIAGGYAFDLTIPYVDLNDAGNLVFRKAVIYDATDANKKPLMYIDFGETKTFAQFDRMQFAFPGTHAVTFAAG